EQQGIDSKGFLEFFDCPGSRQGVEDLKKYDKGYFEKLGYFLDSRVVDLLDGFMPRDREAEVFQVSNDDAAVAQRRLEDKQLEEKTNTDCLVKEREKVHLGIKVGANITITGVSGQEGAEGNVAEKKKEVYES
ncbi:hypothetical protein Tco_0643842, partial [Tanacetum coccineum]